TIWPWRTWMLIPLSENWLKCRLAVPRTSALQTVLTLNSVESRAAVTEAESSRVPEGEPDGVGSVTTRGGWPIWQGSFVATGPQGPGLPQRLMPHVVST